MLVSIALGVFILCVIYVAYWSVKNDSAKSIEEQVGFIKMRAPKSSSRRPAGPSHRRPATHTDPAGRA